MTFVDLALDTVVSGWALAKDRHIGEAAKYLIPKVKEQCQVS